MYIIVIFFPAPRWHCLWFFLLGLSFFLY